MQELLGCIVLLMAHWSRSKNLERMRHTKLNEWPKTLFDEQHYDYGSQYFIHLHIHDNHILGVTMM
jgi:hypothetical protein